MKNKTKIKYLKQKYGSLRKAKLALNLTAKSWQTLAEKLNTPSINKLQEKIKELRQENAYLRKALAENQGFDEVGFWLLDKNFDRARLVEFGLSDDATKFESVAKSEYKRLAKKYHPDCGGTAEQFANLTRLYDQLIVFVEINDGLNK